MITAIENSEAELVAMADIPLSSPEPRCDLMAQMEAVLDPGHIKTTMFIAPGNLRDIFVLCERPIIVRNEGVLFTTDEMNALTFWRAPKLTNKVLAEILDYPQCKLEAMGFQNRIMVQARDNQDRVVQECLVGGRAIDEAAARFKPYCGSGGRIVLLSPIEMQVRRTRLA